MRKIKVNSYITLMIEELYRAQGVLKVVIKSDLCPSGYYRESIAIFHHKKTNEIWFYVGNADFLYKYLVAPFLLKNEFYYGKENNFIIQKINLQSDGDFENYLEYLLKATEEKILETINED